MSTPSEVKGLISKIGPESIEKFCRLKFPYGQFDRCGVGEGSFLTIDYSAAAESGNARALSDFLNLTVDGTVQVIGRFMDLKIDIPILVYSVALKGSITSRSSRKKQADFARFLLNTAQLNLARYRSDWSCRYTTALFFFHDEAGNFRMSLIETDEKRFRRFTFFVEQDDTGTKNRTFRYRMTNASSSDKAARGELQKWTSYQDIKSAFSVETLTKEFYQKLFDWYERAHKDKAIEFPNDIRDENDNQDLKQEHLIRLITRLMFVWFIKQKYLVPDILFDKYKLEKILKSFDPMKGDAYYRAILQNLFFATLNSEIPERAFAIEGGREENREHFDIKTLYRYKDEFAIPEADILALFRSIPFLNGGLFECLDRGRNYADGFSRNPKCRAHIPNKYFFSEDEDSLGLIPLLSRYNFTVDENAHDDEDVALDPELLGKVFENLLGAYNPETKVAARKATGSFYTPREIVNYMVDESLIAHLLTKVEEVDGSRGDAEARREELEKIVRRLFADGIRPADEALCKRLDDALVSAKILDPACGSGAFPMGMLLRMVELLRILRKTRDEESSYNLKLELIENCIYGVDIQSIAVQIAKLRFFISLVCEQTPTANPAENYGINPLPNLETKFVAADSLIGLPDASKDSLDLSTGNIAALKDELFDIRHRHFLAKTYKEKKSLRNLDQEIRKKIKEAVKQEAKPSKEKLELLERERAKVAEPKWENRNHVVAEQAELFGNAPGNKVAEPQSQYDANEKKRKELDAAIAREKKKMNLPPKVVDEIADKLASWDPYDQNLSSPFFDPEWMFNVKDGFDVVIGNPPYINVELVPAERKRQYATLYKTIFKRYDVFGLFYEAALTRFAGSAVKVSFIVPQQIANNLSYRKLRDLILDNRWLREVLYLGDKVFEAANNDVCVLSLSKPSNSTIRLVYALDFANPQVTVVPSDHFKRYGNVISFSSDTGGEVVFQKMFSGKRWRIRDKFTVFQGIVTGNNAAFLPTAEQVRDAGIEKKLLRPVVLGRDFGKWCIRSTERRIIYVDETISIRKYPNALRWLSRFKNELQHGRSAEERSTEWYCLHRPRVQAELDRVPKILVQRTRNPRLSTRIVAAMDETNGIYGMESVIFIVPLADDAPIYFLLAVLNSKLVNYLFATKYLNVAIKAEYLKDLPMPDATAAEVEKLSGLARDILGAKKADPTADITDLEKQIDEKVYELYGITESERAIIEAASPQEAKKAKKGRTAGKKKDSTVETPGETDLDGGKAEVADAEESDEVLADTGARKTDAAGSESAPKRHGRKPGRDTGLDL